MPIIQSFPSFNSGELSPYLLFRTDFSKHASGAERMENFLPLPFGAFTKRPGTRFLRTMLSGGENSLLLPFVAAGGEKYLLHFTPGVLKIYWDDGTTAAALDFMAGYDWDSSEHSLRDVRIEPINDIAFICHPATFPLRLRRLGDTDWKLGFIPFEKAPVLDGNTNKNRRMTVASNPIAPTWADGATYAEGDVVFTDSEWKCLDGHTAGTGNKPGDSDGWHPYWQRMFYQKGDPVTLLNDERSATAWAALYHFYPVGAVVYNPTPDSDPWGFFDYTPYRSNSDHTEDASSSTADAVWSPIATWGTALNPDPLFEVGDLCIAGTDYTDYTAAPYHLFSCLQEHAEASKQPYVPATDWADYWTDMGELPAPGRFERHDIYRVGDVRAADGRVFECVERHLGKSDYRPLTGDLWETVWVEISGLLEAFESSAFAPGQYFKISPERDAQDFQIELAAVTGNDGEHSEPIAVQGAWNFFTYGTWSGTYQLQRSANGGNSWRTIRSWQATDDRNVADSGTEDTPVLLRLRFVAESGTASSGAQRGLLIPESPFVTGYALVDTWLEAGVMTGFAKTEMLSGSTWRWAEGAFNARDGYPRAQVLFERRLGFAGTAALPISLWLSSSGDPLDFETGTNDDRGMFRTLFASAAHPIRWMLSQRRLLLGTSRAEWICGSETQDEGLTPTNFNARIMTGIGSEERPALVVNDSILFTGRNGNRLHELVYADRSYAVQDLSTLAEHLTLSGITSMAWQQTRLPGLWMVTAGGMLVHLAMDHSQEILAWTRHTTRDGLFRDVVVIPSDSGDDDVFVIVDRGAATCLERFPSGWLAAYETGATAAVVDSAVMDEDFPDHFADSDISGLADGLPFSDTVPDGAATFTAGIPIDSVLKLLPVDTTTDTGGTHGRVKRANEMVLNLQNTWGGGVSYDGEEQDFTLSTVGDIMGTPVVLRTGWYAVTLKPAHVTDLQPSIVHSAIYPFTCRGAVLRWMPHEP